MEYRFYKDPDTGLPHCIAHGVSEREAIEVLRRPGDQLRRKDGTTVVEGQTLDGRYLRIITRPYALEGYSFVITAYDMTGNDKRAYRRRHRFK